MIKMRYRDEGPAKRPVQPMRRIIREVGPVAHTEALRKHIGARLGIWGMVVGAAAGVLSGAYLVGGGELSLHQVITYWDIPLTTGTAACLPGYLAGRFDGFLLSQALPRMLLQSQRASASPWRVSASAAGIAVSCMFVLLLAIGLLLWILLWAPDVRGVIVLLGLFLGLVGWPACTWAGVSLLRRVLPAYAVLWSSGHRLPARYQRTPVSQSVTWRRPRACLPRVGK